MKRKKEEEEGDDDDEKEEKEGDDDDEKEKEDGVDEGLRLRQRHLHSGSAAKTGDGLGCCTFTQCIRLEYSSLQISQQMVLSILPHCLVAC